MEKKLNAHTVRADQDASNAVFRFSEEQKGFEPVDEM